MIKKLFFAAAFVSAGTFAGAQTNGGFENWSSQYGEPIQPTGWVTPNIFRLISPSNDTSAFRVGAPNNIMGTYTLKLKTIVLAVNPDTTTIPDTLGLAYEGSVVPFPFSIKDRIPFTSRPGSIHFIARYTPMGVDTGFCYVELSRWNSSLGRRDTIAQGLAVIPTSTSPLSYLTPLFYYPNHMNQYPDSMALVFSSSSAFTPKPGSLLWADDVYFTGWNSVQDMNAGLVNAKAFPNPAKEMITFSADIDRAEQVRIYDGLGRTLGTYEMKNRTYTLNTSGLRAGNYFYSVLDKSGTVLGGNTFTVEK